MFQTFHFANALENKLQMDNVFFLIHPQANTKQNVLWIHYDWITRNAHNTPKSIGQAYFSIEKKYIVSHPYVSSRFGRHTDLLLMSARISNPFHYACDYIESSPKRLFSIFKPSYYTVVFCYLYSKYSCCENNHNQRHEFYHTTIRISTGISIFSTKCCICNKEFTLKKLGFGEGGFPFSRLNGGK